MPIWSGSCHCGAVRFQVEAEIEELTRCDCSLCRRKGALMAKVHERGVTVLAGEENLREVTMFPMTQSAQDLLMNAPSPANPKQLKELHLKIVYPEK